MPLKPYCPAIGSIILLLGLPVCAQTSKAAASPPELPAPQSVQTSAPQTPIPDTQGIPDVPGLDPDLHGWNAGVTFSSVHDSVSGWATLFTPAIGYSFNDIFSADISCPIYFYRLADSRSTHPKPNAELVPRRGEPGDILVGLHAQFVPRLFQYQLTGAFTIPTGDEAYGLSTGRVTFDISNVFQRSYGRFTPNLELGGGDSTTFVNRTVTKNYTSLGPLAHFQIGVSVDLFHNISFESDAYEQLPIGDQKIYGPSRNGKATVVTGHNVTEDNGFTNSLDVPISRNITLSGYYSRSLRLHSDTAGAAVTFVLRTAPTTEETALDDLFR